MRSRKLEHQALRGRWAAITPVRIPSPARLWRSKVLLLRLPICFAALAALAPLPLQLPCRLQPPPFAARPRPRLFGSNRVAAARVRVAHCATSDLGGQPRAARALPLLLSCSPHPKLGPVALYDRALALPCPIAPFRPPASRQHVPPTPARPAAGPPAHRAIAAAPVHLTLPPSACGAGSAPGYPAHAPRVAPSRLHGQGRGVRADARG